MRRMMLWLMAASIGVLPASAQKKPLDHSVYDGWESIGSRQITNDGRFVAFEVNPQEGDGKLVLMAADKSWQVEVPRGYAAKLSGDSRYAIFKIKPTYAQTREARIKKKKPDDMPKDSLGYLTLGAGDMNKVARVKSFQLPEDAGTWMAYLKEKPLPDTTKKKPAGPPKNPQLDSAKLVIDSLQQIINALPEKVKKKYLDEGLLEEDDFYADEPADGDGAELVWHDLSSGKTLSFKSVNEYAVAKKGNRLAIEGAKPGKDSLAKPAIVVVDVATAKADTIMKGFSDAKNLTFDEEGRQLAFVAERDSSEKAKKKFFKLWYWQAGADSAKMVAQKGSPGLMDNMLVNDKSNISFSKSGRRLFFGMGRNWPDKDTSLPEFDRVSVDVWHYNDDYLQPMQLKNLSRDLDRSYLSVYHPASGKLLQLADANFENIRPTGEGDGRWFIATDDRAGRVASQWQGRGKADLYVVDPETGTNRLVKAGADGIPYGTDPQGEQLVWYDNTDRQYHVWQNGKETIVSKSIPVPLYDEENDVPDDPRPHGLMAWEKDGSAFYIYDKYDIWKIDLRGGRPPVCITGGEGRKAKTEIRYQDLNRDEPWVMSGEDYLFRLFDTKTKKTGIVYHELGKGFGLGPSASASNPAQLGNFVKAKHANTLAYSTETYERSPDMRAAGLDKVMANPLAVSQLYQPNPQQSQYNWGTAELVEWKAYDGKMTQGLVYKPENFDPNKKYPMIAYFYETLSDGLYAYQAPAPTPSRLNISFFVSRGYVVFAPDIHYRTGYPGQSAYDYIVSGARHLVKLGYVDSTKMGLQGQSWGGYQIAYLITQTPLFAAAWAGAPVANMTSAYGGIRWGTGLNRQFQYEKTQSRIGGNLWEKKDLYLKNSPLFYIPNITTPLVIMHNDEDGAVPWYQGIEMFTAMRRMGKKVWMLNYNGEDHNLVQRKNRKDISIREQQFFDWMLKGEKPAPWLEEGVPATMKGRDLGLGNQ